MSFQNNIKVGILGAGQWGTTLSILANRANHPVWLYDHNPQRALEIQKTRINKQYLQEYPILSLTQVTSDLQMVLTSCKILICVIPSYNFRNFLKQCAPFLKKNQIFIHGIKGLEPKSFKRMSEVILEETPCLRVGTISGPNLAPELANGEPAATVIASTSKQVIYEIQKFFSTPQFRVYGNKDILGVEWAGSLKNILAIAAGMVESLGFGNNTRAMLLTRGFAEINRLMVKMGSHSSTLLSLAGLGDVLTTCTSPISRNYRAGQLIANGHKKNEIEKKLSMTVEGFNTISVVHDLSKKKKIELPITNALYQIIFQEHDLRLALQGLMLRPNKLEFEWKSS